MVAHRSDRRKQGRNLSARDGSSTVTRDGHWLRFIHLLRDRADMSVFEPPSRIGIACALSLIATAAPGCRASGQEKLIRFGRSPAEVTTAWADQSRITYRVLLDRPQTQTVDIRIEVDDVSQPQLDFVLPTWRPGRYIVLDFAGSVSQVVATDGGGRELPLSDGLRLYQEYSRIASASDDAREGNRAFAEKRDPDYSNR